MSYLISATWWNYRSIYIPEYFQYWIQLAVINLITTRREFTLFPYSKILSSIITSLCIIFNICYMMNQQYYIYSRILPVLISTCCNEFNHYKTRITVLQYTTTLSSIIASFCIIFDICYMMNQQYYIYSRILPVLISACRIEFNHYKREFTVLQYTTALSRLIISFCVIFDICYMMNLSFYIYSRILPVLISACRMEFNHYKRKFTVLQYSTTLSSVITSFCIVFDICYMSNLPFYIYSWILPVLISKCCIEFNHYKTWIYSITVFYNTLKLNHIILYHIWYLQYIKLSFYIYSRILPVFISTCFIEFNH